MILWYISFGLFTLLTICFCFKGFRYIVFFLFDEFFKNRLRNPLDCSNWLSVCWKWLVFIIETIIYYIVAFLMIGMAIIVVSLLFFPYYKIATKRATEYWTMRLKMKRMMTVSANKYKDYKPQKDWEKTSREVLYFNKKNFPFKPVENQIIYVESQYDAVYNNYVKTDYNELHDCFEDSCCVFSYIPNIKENLESRDVFLYNNPSCDASRMEEKDEVNSSTILSYLVEARDVAPGLIRLDESLSDDECIAFSYFSFASVQEVPFEQQINWYVHHLSRSQGPLYSLGEKDKEDDGEEVFADYKFTMEAKNLIEEIRERVEKLHQIGVNEMVLKRLFQPDDKLSRLVVTEDFRIMLPDYNEMEITMAPLPKAVFFLFLRHSEGILFKHLMDYRNELSDIYNKISNRTMKESIEKSISDITDPTNNSINEKCARIREAFITKFDERLACNYFVTGKRGEVKKILLPTDMVEWKIKL